MSAGRYVPLGAFGPPILRQLVDAAIGRVACALGAPHYRVGSLRMVDGRLTVERYFCDYCQAPLPPGPPGTSVKQ